MQLRDGSSVIEIQVIRSDRKTLALEIKDDLIVRARIPKYVTDRQLREFVAKNEEWIRRKHRAMREKVARRPAMPRPLPTKEEQQEILEKIVGRVRHYEEVMGLFCNRITVRDQKTRWGSCSSKGNLNFNYRLAYMPSAILDYVVVHELAHLRHMDHSKEFWALVGVYLPDYKERRKWLKEHGGEY